MTPPVLKTSFPNVDAFLGGGLRAGRIALLVGPAASMKTMFALNVVQHVTREQHQPVLWFSSDEPAYGHVNSLKKMDAARKLAAAPSPDFARFLDVDGYDCPVEFMRTSVESWNSNFGQPVAAIVVDSLTMLPASSPPPGFPGLAARSAAESERMHLISALAHDLDVAVLVTAHGRKPGVSTPSMMGKSAGYVSDHILSIAREQEGCEIQVVKSRSWSPHPPFGRNVQLRFDTETMLLEEHGQVILSDVILVPGADLRQVDF